MKYAHRKLIATGAVCAILLPVAVLGYQKVLRSGIENLDSEPCKGAVKRTTAARILPDSRTASESSRTGQPGDNWILNCALKTSGGANISIEARIHKSTVEEWESFYNQNLNEESVTLPGEIESLSWSRNASVYIPCTPQGSEDGNEKHPYSLITVVRISGETRVSGVELRQAITDLAFQAAKHSYGLAKCQENVNFPAKPPRVPSE